MMLVHRPPAMVDTSLCDLRVDVSAALVAGTLIDCSSSQGRPSHTETWHHEEP